MLLVFDVTLFMWVLNLRPVVYASLIFFCKLFRKFKSFLEILVDGLVWLIFWILRNFFFLSESFF